MAGKTRYTVFDLFCGCGGASLGFKLAGCEIVGAVDIDKEACETYGKNIVLSPLRVDLRRATGGLLLRAFSLRRGDVDIVVGCPPCQPYSSLHNTMGNGAWDGRDLFQAYVRVVGELKPSAVVLENVPGLVVKPLFSRYLMKMSKMGYASHYAVLNAAHFGVPQNRRRLVCISMRTGRRFPQVGFEDFASNRVRTVRDAIGDMPPLRAGESHPWIPNHSARSHSKRVLDIIRAIPKDGGSRRSLPKGLWLHCHLRLEENGGGAESTYGRMWWDRPAPTITTRCTTPSSGRFVHPEQDRAITPREAARLQTFPDDFVFPDRFAVAERLVGNAVPPLLSVNCIVPYIRAHAHLF